jgi:hypothetical protein
MRTFCIVSLLLAVSGAWGQSTPPDNSSAPDAKPNPNVVVLDTEARFWKDPALDKRVSVSLKDAGLGTAVTALAKASKLSLMAHAGPKAGGKVTLSLKNVPLRDAMLTLEQSFGLRWHKNGTLYSLEYDPKRTARFAPLSAFKRPALTPLQSGVKLQRVGHTAKRKVKVIYQVVQ